jgi:NADPH:quinone reductase-like Zn-dependent oxidoreductase
MRAVRFARFGEPTEVVSIEELPQPQPAPGEVLVRLRARPINPSDLFALRGSYGALPPLPATPGMEGAGTIAALGEGVATLQVGQPVVVLGGNGTWQEYAIVRADEVIPLPPGLSDQQAATIVVNPVTALVLLRELGLSAGGLVLQNAANSAVGRHVIQLSRYLGLRTINLVRRLELRDELLAEGADHVLLDDNSAIEQIKALSGGKGVRGALDSVGGPSGSRLARSLAAGGTLLVFGAISGQPLALDPGAMVFRGTTVRGWWLARWLRSASAEQRAEAIGTVVELVRNGTLRTPIAAEYDLAEIDAALRAAQGSERNGKILLVG